MDDKELATLISLLMESVLASGALVERVENAQIVVRPIFTWPDGEPAVWAIVNCPN